MRHRTGMQGDAVSAWPLKQGVGLAAGLLLLVGGAPPLLAQPGDFAAPVVIGRAVERELAEQAEFLASVQVRRSVTVGAEVAARVEERLVSVGDYVEAGAVLVRLRTRPVELAMAEALALATTLERELAEARAGPRKPEIAAARAVVAAREAELRYAQWALGRVEKLLQRDSVPEDEVERARRDLGLAEAQLAEAQARLALLEEGTRPEQIAAAESRLAAARQGVLRLEDQLERHVIKAPFAAYVTEELSEVGGWIGVGEGVMRLSGAEQVEVEATVPELLVARLRQGQMVSVGARALGEERFDGPITAILTRGDARSRTFGVRIRLPNPRTQGQPRWREGMSALVTADLGAAQKRLLVPKDALVLGSGRPLIYVVKGEGAEATAAIVPVLPGPSFDGYLEVPAGSVQPGDALVIRGNERLRPGQKVIITAELGPDGQPIGGGAPGGARGGGPR